MVQDSKLLILAQLNSRRGILRRQHVRLCEDRWGAARVDKNDVLIRSKLAGTNVVDQSRKSLCRVNVFDQEPFGPREQCHRLDPRIRRLAIARTEVLADEEYVVGCQSSFDADQLRSTIRCR